VADYDCDGATACAVALRGLAMLGADAGTLGYVVPDRAVHGYGLTPAIVDLALAQRSPTAGDGGQRHRQPRRRGPCPRAGPAGAGHRPPPAGAADGAVSRCPMPTSSSTPTSPAAAFASKALAGVGVMFYVLLATRAELRARGALTRRAAAPGRLLDLVALGTVADVVKLDANNRRLVAQGLKRVRSRAACSRAWRRCLPAAGRDPPRGGLRLRLCAGPAHQRRRPPGRHDAGHRMPADRRRRRAPPNWPRNWTPSTANGARWKAGMRELAEEHADAPDAGATRAPAAVTLFDESFHEGVVGIVAGRVKDRLHRPTFVFARGADGRLKGSGRSIPGFHLRDALDLVAKRHPGLLLRFGGHAMAAGCTLADEAAGGALDLFAAALHRWRPSGWTPPR
jgi:single-stranded-DNA-specific exonuclease